MKFFITLIKIIIGLAVLLAILVGAWIAYEDYKNKKEKQAELNYESSHVWEWHQTYPRIQKYYDGKIKKN